MVDGGGLTWLGRQTVVEVMGDTPFSFFYFVFSFFLASQFCLGCFSFSLLFVYQHTYLLILWRWTFFSFLLLYLTIFIIIIIYINRAVGGVTL